MSACVMQIIKSQFLQILPFIVTVALYFTLVRDPQGELWTTLLKCAPIGCLIIYVLLNGFNSIKMFRFSKCVLLGLIFSCGGDALLNVGLFPHGMGAFALAQISYISAFGLIPIKPLVGMPLFSCGTAMYIVLLDSLDQVLIIALPIYMVLLLTMCWRCLVRGWEKCYFLNVICAAGSLLFVISDTMIVFDMFIYNIPHARIWVMLTYYAAQFTIALNTSAQPTVVHTGPKKAS